MQQYCAGYPDVLHYQRYRNQHPRSQRREKYGKNTTNISQSKHTFRRNTEDIWHAINQCRGLFALLVKRVRCHLLMWELLGKASIVIPLEGFVGINAEEMEGY